ncbi:MAG: hypothetical protein JNL28_16915 [Planctomycetes bacterium]|nr:hypothetical protein [Planctomycetota bacterium]
MARSKQRGIFTHRGLIAAEAVLVLGILKDWIFGFFVHSTLPNYGKVLLVMAATVGLFGGLLVVVTKLMHKGMAGSHKVAQRMPIILPTVFIHAALLFVLFLLYARMLELVVF